MNDPKWERYDRIVLRVWPQMGLRHSNERMNTVALVADILEGHGRYTVSQELREKVEMAARDEKEQEQKP